VNRCRRGAHDDPRQPHRLRQKNLKRLLAYSSIAQAGYLLLGVAVAARTGGALAAVAYYLTAYLFMNLGRAPPSDSWSAL
jgi:hypothetical protein